MSSGDVFRLVLAAAFTICMTLLLVTTLRFHRSEAGANSTTRASHSRFFVVLSGVGVIVGLVQVLLALLQ